MSGPWGKNHGRWTIQGGHPQRRPRRARKGENNRLIQRCVGLSCAKEARYGKVGVKRIYEGGGASPGRIGNHREDCVQVFRAQRGPRRGKSKMDSDGESKYVRIQDDDRRGIQRTTGKIGSNYLDEAR